MLKMINVKQPDSIFLENKSSEHAIILLHSFTGTVRDVKLLATKLHKAGFTCYVPAYKGHGLMLDQFMEYGTDDWWQDALTAYRYLTEQGYNKVSVCGVSLGGLLSLKLAEKEDIEAIAIMSTPYKKSDAGLAHRLNNYCQRMGQVVGLDDAQISKQLDSIDTYSDELNKFQFMVEDIMNNLDKITAPITINYGLQDDPDYRTSAQYIHDHIGHETKYLNGFPDSKHLMTHGSGREAVEQEIIAFFEDHLDV